MESDKNAAAQLHWGNASQFAGSAQAALEDAARALQSLGPVSEGHEYAARVAQARLHIDRALSLAERANAEYAASDAVWEPIIPECTLGL